MGDHTGVHSLLDEFLVQRLNLGLVALLVQVVLKRLLGLDLVGLFLGQAAVANGGSQSQVGGLGLGFGQRIGGNAQRIGQQGIGIDGGLGIVEEALQPRASEATLAAASLEGIGLRLGDQAASQSLVDACLVGLLLGGLQLCRGDAQSFGQIAIAFAAHRAAAMRRRRCHPGVCRGRQGRHTEDQHDQCHTS